MALVEGEKQTVSLQFLFSSPEVVTTGPGEAGTGIPEEALSV